MENFNYLTAIDNMIKDFKTKQYINCNLSNYYDEFKNYLLTLLQLI